MNDFMLRPCIITKYYGHVFCTQINTLLQYVELAYERRGEECRKEITYFTFSSLDQN